MPKRGEGNREALLYISPEGMIIKKMSLWRDVTACVRKRYGVKKNVNVFGVTVIETGNGISESSSKFGRCCLSSFRTNDFFGGKISTLLFHPLTSDEIVEWVL